FLLFFFNFFLGGFNWHGRRFFSVVCALGFGGVGVANFGRFGGVFLWFFGFFWVCWCVFFFFFFGCFNGVVVTIF
ncbi:hypothetical protein, partial [Pectobacterium versatile]|uniref:hypothetical protein n=1 Tax=Pectobacterium versatile TaxID=2488639 RepID=UPI001968AC85